MTRLIISILICFVFTGTIDAQQIKKVFYNKYWRKCDNNEECKYYRTLQKTKDTLNRKIFVARDFYKNDTLQMEGIYLDSDAKLKDGKFTYYFQNGQISSTGVYIDNHRQGEFRGYYETGHLKYISEYLNDSIIKDKGFFEDSVVSETSEFRNGRRHGKYFTFYPNGKVLREDTYDNGTFTSGKCFTNSGEDTIYFPHRIEPRYPDGYKKFIEYLGHGIQVNGFTCGTSAGRLECSARVDTTGKLIEPRVIFASESCYYDNIFAIIERSLPWVPGKIDGIIKELTIYFTVTFR